MTYYEFDEKEWERRNYENWGRPVQDETTKILEMLGIPKNLHGLITPISEEEPFEIQPEEIPVYSKFAEAARALNADLKSVVVPKPEEALPEPSKIYEKIEQDEGILTLLSALGKFDLIEREKIKSKQKTVKEGIVYQPRIYTSVEYNDGSGWKKIDERPIGYSGSLPVIWGLFNKVKDSSRLEEILDSNIGRLLPGEIKYRNKTIGELLAIVHEKTKPFINSLATSRALFDKLGSGFVSIGCGTGADLDENSIGIDINEWMLQRAKERGYEVIRASAGNIPIKNLKRVSFPYSLHSFDEKTRKRVYEQIKDADLIVVTLPAGSDVIDDLVKRFNGRYIRYVPVLVKYLYEDSKGEGEEISKSVGVVISKEKIDIGVPTYGRKRKPTLPPSPEVERIKKEINIADEILRNITPSMRKYPRWYHEYNRVSKYRNQLYVKLRKELEKHRENYQNN